MLVRHKQVERLRGQLKAAQSREVLLNRLLVNSERRVISAAHDQSATDVAVHGDNADSGHLVSLLDEINEAIADLSVAIQSALDNWLLSTSLTREEVCSLDETYKPAGQILNHLLLSGVANGQRLRDVVQPIIRTLFLAVLWDVIFLPFCPGLGGDHNRYIDHTQRHIQRIGIQVSNPLVPCSLTHQSRAARGQCTVARGDLQKPSRESE